MIDTTDVLVRTYVRTTIFASILNRCYRKICQPIKLLITYTKQLEKSIGQAQKIQFE